MFQDDQDQELLYHSYTNRVTRSKKRPHKLSDAIENNYSASRKHDKTMFKICSILDNISPS